MKPKSEQERYFCRSTSAAAKCRRCYGFCKEKNCDLRCGNDPARCGRVMDATKEKWKI